MSDRYFVRCTTCLAISAVDELPDPYTWKCGVCDGGIEIMGHVERNRLVQTSYVSPCDDRCCFARGPHCDCQCGGKNHGSKLLVRVTRDVGAVPRVTPATGREQARINAAEYRALREAAMALLDPLLASKRRGYLPAAEYDRMRKLQAANRKAHEARTHTARVKALRAVVGHLPAPASHPVAAVAVETHAAIVSAAPLAEVPFSLNPTTSNRTAKQETLF